MSTRDRRVTLALKWHHLENLDVGEIRDRFEEEGIGDYTRSTIRKYLNEEPAEEVLEQIEQEHANVRLQAAERYERLYQDARHDHDELAVDDEPVVAMKPRMETHQDRHDKRVSDWEYVEPGDDRRPEWATERDVVVVFTEGDRLITEGEEYPAGAEHGGPPEYRKAVVGLRRDQPRGDARAMARKEMAGHLHEKADVLGVYSTDINMTVDGDVEHSVEFDSETAAAIREATLDGRD